jgi:hypothetical protein
MKSNKEVIDKLTEFFTKKCDRNIVSHCLASMMIDMRRIRHINDITEGEQESLHLRMIQNDFELENFIEKDGNVPPLKLTNFSIDKD